ncbi:hypothetical protein [Streptomyces sp. KL116D]|uniref:hypothetical protein n=1 Tax=Streptomyces sp. KL116D TaxID=3045152 RepID=UPI0035572231
MGHAAQPFHGVLPDDGRARRPPRAARALLEPRGVRQRPGRRPTVGTEAELLAAIRELARAKPVFFKDTTDERYPALLADAGLPRPRRHAHLHHPPPAETIASYHALNPEVRLHQIGGEAQFEIYRAVAARSARPPAVIDSADLVTDAPA